MTVHFPNSEFELKDVIMIRFTEVHDLLRQRFRAVDPSARERQNSPLEGMSRDTRGERILNYEHTFTNYHTVREDGCQVILNLIIPWRSGRLNKLRRLVPEQLVR